MKPAERVYLFEGPDGSGKSTAAEALAADLGVAVTHHGPLVELGGPALAAAYASSMLPALLGERPVVLDRAWPSESVYGPVFRKWDRLSTSDVAGLRGLFDRCAGIEVLCLTDADECLSVYRRRRGEEYLPSEVLVREVWCRYAEAVVASLRGREARVVHHDRLRDDVERLEVDLHEARRLREPGPAMSYEEFETYTRRCRWPTV